MGDLARVRFFPPEPLVGDRFFLRHIFLEFFSPSISFQEFFLLKISRQDILKNK